MAKGVKVQGRSVKEQGQSILHGLSAALDKAARGIKGDFEQTTDTWSAENKPVFLVVKRGQYKRIIGTESAIYKYVTHGTKPHLIRPKPGGAIAFNVPYRAKTAPMQVRSAPGGAGATRVFVSRPVQHPGIKARKFDEVIRDKWAKKLAPMIKVEIGK